MATATLTRRSRKSKSPPILPRTPFDEGSTSAFFMPAGSMSLDEFRRWTSSDAFPKTGSIAYIGKEIFVDMSPERITSHGLVRTAISGTLIPLVFRKKKGKILFDRARVVNVSAEVSNEPDGVLALFESLKSGKVRLVPTLDGDDFIELEGSPDWMLEVISRSSVTKDRKKLRASYHKAGIGEYWLVDARGEEIDFQILVRGESDYEPAKTSGTSTIDWT